MIVISGKSAAGAGKRVASEPRGVVIAKDIGKDVGTPVVVTITGGAAGVAGVPAINGKKAV